MSIQQRLYPVVEKNTRDCVKSNTVKVINKLSTTLPARMKHHQGNPYPRLVDLDLEKFFDLVKVDAHRKSIQYHGDE